MYLIFCTLKWLLQRLLRCKAARHRKAIGFLHIVKPSPRWWEGGHFDHTTCFFVNSGKPPFSTFPVIHQFCTLVGHFSTESSHVRSPGQVKWSYLKKIFTIAWRLPTVFKASTWNFQELIRASVPTKHTYIPEFRFRVRSIPSPDHYEAKGNCSQAVFPKVPVWTCYLKIFLYLATLDDL